MNKGNGSKPDFKVLHGVSADFDESQNPQPTITPKQANSIMKQLATSMVPFTPVSFQGQQLPFALLRLGVYGTLTYLTWKRARKLSYAFAGATGVSALTSIMSGVWEKQNEGAQ